MTASKCLGAALLFASLFPAIGIAADADGDGMDDAWQALWFIPAFDGGNDYDGDGRINLVESINRSDPINTVDSGLGVVTITDVNPADGMDDHWQAVYSIPSGDALLDEDSDGRTAIEESIVFSNPHVADAPWQHPPGSIGTAQPTPSSFTLTLPQTIPTQRYRLQTCTDMVGWVDVPGAIVWATGAPITDTVDTTGDTRRFFRYIVDAPDGDADDLDDWAEVMVFQTSITNADTDGDGWSDGAEAAAGADPADGGINPATIDTGLLSRLVQVESEDGRFYDWWSGTRTVPPELGQEWTVSHGLRSFNGGTLIFPNTTSTVHSGAWSPPDLGAVPEFVPELPWSDLELGTFDFPPDVTFTPGAFAMRYGFEDDAYKTKQWHMDWKRFRLKAVQPLDVAVNRDFLITRRLWNWTAQGWVRSGAEETVVMKLTLPKGAIYSSYSYLTPLVPADGGLIEYWVGQAEKGLTIYHGGRDPVAVTESDEETVGAFTVANRNDTDGDGTDDHSDNDVTATGEGTEDEVDLMKMIIAAPPAEGTATVKLTDGISSGIKLWETPKKGVEIPLNQESALVIPSTELPKIVYIEATSHSADVRSIEFTMDFQPTNGAAQPNFDKVKATAIWVVASTSVKNTASDTMWGGIDPVVRDQFIVQHGTKFGPKFDNGSTHAATYSIGLSFQPKPDGLATEPVFFDIGRKVEGKYWALVNGSYTQIDDVPSVSGDLVNDDTVQEDEDVVPDDDLLYSLDSPGWRYSTDQVPSVPDANPNVAFALNFEEFVRVSFNGGVPSGNRLAGSRCGPSTKWHAASTVTRIAPSQWPTRGPSGYAPVEGRPNSVGKEHITIQSPAP